ncbi:hyaluronan mediated motility receptor isoform X2 [Cyprinodon tularosa]|uniref:hyaluronan mediated motility receptor isoform X2 n=1 Tax=Cyprinodon tularosa TaxID=77115 RepID=UPI0018E25827|nr:hyaluronan mediated motility receptor isoform X2 [Cyprinodon tularosa]
MSFSRAPLKRFNEHVGCAPPPGSYEIKPQDAKGAASFNKSDRFRPVQAAGAALLPPSPSRSISMSPVRRTLSADGLAEGSSSKKERKGMTFERKQLNLLEKEIRSLVHQRGEQDRRLLILQDDLKKAEAKLLAAVREKTGLSASVITLERQQAELRRVNDFLKNKVSADSTKKRINSLTMELMEARNNLDAKNKELSLLHVTTEGQMKALESELNAARATVSSLQDRNKDLEDLHQVTKTQNAELEMEIQRLNGVILELRGEIRLLQEYLDAANDQIQDLRLKIQEMMQENNPAEHQGEKIKLLEMEVEQRAAELHTAQELMKQKEEEADNFEQELQASMTALLEAERRLENQELELKAAQKSVADTERQLESARQEAEDSQTDVRQKEAELSRLREVLRKTESELQEKVAHLEQKCLISEEQRTKTQDELLRRVEELQNELNFLQQAERDRLTQLEQEKAVLTEERVREKALVDSLTALLEQEREGSEERMRHLKEEMEEVLGELAVMEEQEQKSQELAEKRQVALRCLQREKEELEKELKETKAQMEGSSDVAAMKSLHLAAMSELQEAYNSSQKQMEDIATELQSTKEALKEAEGRQRELEAEVGRVTCQLKEAMDKMVEQKEEEINRVRGWTDEQQERLEAEAKAREESSRMLLEVQARLAQQEEQIKAADASHAAQIGLLQKELQMQQNEKEKALRCVEEQRNLSAAEIQNEREKAQKLLEELGHQKEEIMKRLQEEQEEKAQIQAALQEERAALEVERNHHQQVRSELLGLQAELHKVDEERRSLLSDVELKKEFSHALEKELGRAERDRDQLQSRLDDSEQDNAAFKAQLVHMLEKMEALQQELDRKQEDGGALREQVEALTQEKVTLQWEMEEQRRELQRRLAEVQEESFPRSEVELWKKRYEELISKVGPFQEQLNAFSAERDALLNENGANQVELNKLADAYARLLGHQNQKQKIKHVMKLKDENISLKQEVSKLRTLVSRQKSDLDQLRGKQRRRFDPSKAFHHDKENVQTETNEPLRDGNRKE